MLATLEAPDWGYRLIDMDGDSQGANPLKSPTLTWEMADGSLQNPEAKASQRDGYSVFTLTPPEGSVGAIVTDAYGNEGRLKL